MTSMSATAFRQNLYQTIAQVNEESKPITITTSKGKGAVLVGEDDWTTIKETLYLMSIPGMNESLTEGKATDVDDCVGKDDLDW